MHTNLYKWIIIIYSILSLPFIVILLYPFDLIQTNTPIKIINTTIKPGDTLYYTFKYKKPYNVTGTLIKGLEIKGGEWIICMPPMVGNIETGENIIKATFNLPKSNFILGEARLRFIVKYEIFGGIRTIRDIIESDTFLITN